VDVESLELRVARLESDVRVLESRAKDLRDGEEDATELEEKLD
jgi:hypothetical protein